MSQLSTKIYFTEFEKNLILSLVKPFIEIIENKETSAGICAKKTQAFAEIAKKFNATVGVNPRTEKQIRQCYMNLKKKILKKSKCIDQEHAKTEITKTKDVEISNSQDSKPAVVGIAPSPLPEKVPVSNPVINAKILVLEPTKTKPQDNTLTRRELPVPSTSVKAKERDSLIKLQAHSKLKRLLNEAERQRRRRERLRSGPRSTTSLLPLPPPPPPVRHDGVMTALKTCTRFQDFVRELNVMGFSLTQHDTPTNTDEVMPEVDGVKVQIEMIEGEEELSTDFKGDSTSQDSNPAGRLHLDEEEAEEDEEEESYREWFERQSELQQRWEEGMMREQMELARGMLESVTSTFLQGVQQVVEGIISAGKRRRRRTSFCQRPPSP